MTATTTQYDRWISDLGAGIEQPAVPPAKTWQEFSEDLFHDGTQDRIADEYLATWGRDIIGALLECVDRDGRPIAGLPKGIDLHVRGLIQRLEDEAAAKGIELR